MKTKIEAEEKKSLLFVYGDTSVESPRLALTQIPTHFRESTRVSRGANTVGLQMQNHRLWRVCVNRGAKGI